MSWCASCGDRPVSDYGDLCPLCSKQHGSAEAPAQPKKPDSTLVIGTIGCLIGLMFSIGFILGFVARGRG